MRTHGPPGLKSSGTVKTLSHTVNITGRAASEEEGLQQLRSCSGCAQTCLVPASPRYTLHQEATWMQIQAMESGRYQTTQGHKKEGNWVSYVHLLLIEFFVFQRSVSMPWRSQTAFFFFLDNLYLSFLEDWVCIQNKKRETDLYNKLADAHLGFSLKAEQLFILVSSRAKQMGLILLPVLAKLRLLRLVPKCSWGRQCQLPLGHRGSLSMAWYSPEAVTVTVPVSVLLL